MASSNFFAENRRFPCSFSSTSLRFAVEYMCLLILLEQYHETRPCYFSCFDVFRPAKSKQNNVNAGNAQSASSQPILHFLFTFLQSFLFAVTINSFQTHSNRSKSTSIMINLWIYWIICPWIQSIELTKSPYLLALSADDWVETSTKHRQWQWRVLEEQYSVKYFYQRRRDTISNRAAKIISIYPTLDIRAHETRLLCSRGTCELVNFLDSFAAEDSAAKNIELPPYFF